MTGLGKEPSVFEERMMAETKGWSAQAPSPWLRLPTWPTRTTETGNPHWREAVLRTLSAASFDCP